MSKSFATSACFYFEAVSGNMSQHKRIGFRRPGSRKPLNKTMLLPLPNISVQKISLPVHLALAACRGVAGNAHLMSELVRVVYLSYFLAEDGEKPSLASATPSCGGVPGKRDSASEVGAGLATVRRRCWRTGRGNCIVRPAAFDRSDLGVSGRVRPA